MIADRQLYKLLLIIAPLVALYWLQLATDGLMFAPSSVSSMLTRNGPMIVMAIGLSLVMACGHIDMSMGAVCGLAGAFAAVLMVSHHVHYVPATLITLAIGAAIGGFHGFLVAYVRMPAFIVTLASALVYRGLTYNMLPNVTLGPLPAEVTRIGAGWIADPFAVTGFYTSTFAIGLIVATALVAISMRSRLFRLQHGVEDEPLVVFLSRTLLVAGCTAYLCYLLAQSRGMPTIALIYAVLTILYVFVASRTVIGRGIFTAGGNEKAAKLSGIPTRRLVLWAFINMGVLTTLAGLIIVARSAGIATRNAGQGVEFDVITACLIGSIFASSHGGKVAGAVFGALAMGFIDQGMVLLGMDNRVLVKGALLLSVVGFDTYFKRANSTPTSGLGTR